MAFALGGVLGMQDMGVSRFSPDVVYDRQSLHADAKQLGLAPGNANSGITVVGNELCIFWNPHRKLYANRWVREPIEFTYSGEGSIGPMTPGGGNGKLLRAEATGTPVQVFYKLQRTGSRWLCLGGYEVVDHEAGVSRGTDDVVRPDLRFQLRRISRSSLHNPLPAVTPPAPPPPLTEQELWDAVQASMRAHGGRRRRRSAFNRGKRVSDPVKTAYVRQRAIDHGGACECCGRSPGWLAEDGLPHFQAHHLDPDIDRVDWIAALCGTCHDRLHHSSDRVAVTSAVLATVRARQQSLGRPIDTKPGG